MSSTERAPEPTMEEILASIRRIISEDEANAATQEPAPEGYRAPAASEEMEADLADPQIIADIERVLSGQNSPAAQADDEILDLADLGTPIEASAEPELVEELVVTEAFEEVTYEESGGRSFADAFPSAAPEAPEPVAPAEPVVAMETGPIEAPQYAKPTPQPAEDPTAALERAIAALKAGDLAAFAREAETKYTAPAYTPPPAAAPSTPSVASSFTPSAEPLPSAGPTLAEQLSAPAAPEPASAGDFAPEAEPGAVLEEELVILSEPEPLAEVEEAPAWSAPEQTVEPAGEAVSTPWHSDDATWAPKSTPPDFVAPAAPRTNGGHGHKSHDFSVSGPKSLEDSVREMLRPMLRKWLDENMQRVLTQALREELDDPERPRRDG